MTRQLLRHSLGEWVDPALVYRALARGQEHSVWLDAGPQASSGLSYISVPSGRLLREDTATSDTSIFEVLRESLEVDYAIDTSAAREDGFALGWVGWFGYELASLTAGVPTADSPTPDACFAYVDWALEFDHAHKSIDLLVLGTEEDLKTRFGLISHALSSATSVEEQVVESHRPVQWRHDAEHYKHLVQKCLDAITAGDAYQLCLTNQARVAGQFDPTSVYLALREANPSHHGGLLHFGDVSLLSSSPEIFLTVDQLGNVATKPIKGTRKRGVNTAHDLALAEELVTSDKERAENLMIVDLMRNDIGKVATLGSVHVEELLTVESYENVHQLVSTVKATLAPGLTAVDAVQACFPAGSMTGAPKISAMTILHKLEQGPRGIYSGAFGYLGIDGAANLAMVIRSIVLTSDEAVIGTGGGITSGSTPQAELEETWLKVEPLLRALGVDSSEYS